MKIIAFCGHSDLSSVNTSKLKITLYNEIKALAEQGAKEFLFCGYGEFDLLCARTVQELKKEYYDILSVIILPYPNKSYDKALYDCSVYPAIEKCPLKIPVLRRSKYMTDNSDAVIAYVCHNRDSAAKALDYANKKGRLIINLTF